MLSTNDIKEIEKLSLDNRRNIIQMVYDAQSGHIGGSLSSCDILTVLFNKCMKKVPQWKSSTDFDKRDRFVLSKGHVSPLYYSVLSQVGYFDKKALKGFRQLGAMLQGHPTPHIPGVEIATGSLGQGLSFACGMAMALKLDKNPANVFALLGDGELQEGSVWEAFMQAAHRNLDNLTAIIDRNRLQIDGNTEDVMALGNVPEKIRAFNWNVIEINGHDINAIYDAIELAKKSDRPTAIVANTVKGKGVSFMENNASWHGKAPNKEEYTKAMQELGGLPDDNN
ncbi:MAG: transketolase [Cyanobacteriota bacterium]|nr:transketolase [Cyanobacteriota bacterium]MDY6358046.1 transketolase [Cyanobacteriota bacterium]MDY6363888.1 transketolase [Cyanobacteriota bacterium]MDY6383343.1 transketolase [Cyanobacteriota bacterium]